MAVWVAEVLNTLLVAIAWKTPLCGSLCIAFTAVLRSVSAVTCLDVFARRGGRFAVEFERVRCVIVADFSYTNPR